MENREETLKQLQALLDSGVLTRAEYEDKLSSVEQSAPQNGGSGTRPAQPETQSAGNAYPPAQQAAPYSFAQQAVPTYALTSSKRHSRNGSKLFYVLGILSGLLSVILGFVTYGMSTGSWESSKSYGGDAYTGIQNAAAQAANNAQDAAQILSFAFGSLLLVLGIALIAFFAAKLVRPKEQA